MPASNARANPLMAAFNAQFERAEQEDLAVLAQQQLLADEAAAAERLQPDAYSDNRDAGDATARRERARDAEDAAAQAGDEEDDADPGAYNAPQPLSWGDYLRLVRDAPIQLFTKLRRVIRPPVLESWDSTTSPESRLAIDYFQVIAACGRQFVMRASDWALPMTLKAGSLGFSISQSAFFFGRCDLGKVFVVWTDERLNVDEDAEADEDGLALADTPLKAGYASIINEYIAWIFATNKEHAITDAEGRIEHTYKQAELSWAQACTMFTAFMKHYEANSKQRFKDALIKGYGNNLSARLESMSVSWATEF
ncbi:hypothetical protein Rhopal_002943-T1 [Rhodotorula paludigena]|uniref:Uncharacterized protein n=1 Tax=Rhodotorula paludigena TaxID=86838 RepID=A0AAV5GJ93_9BASI|nr:hypothetical protein Rhopal_002943-T1 [Rhodotorula paludigena]